jgi:YebC/PmpR family DNA-binding regulatory protein
MPKDNIERAVAKGSGEGQDGAAFETVVYEGYGPEGVAVIVEALTDNRNRTASDVRHLFSKHGGNLGEVGSVNWMFDRKSQILIEEDKAEEEALMMLALDAGADDIRNDGGQWEVLSPPENHHAVLEAIQKAGIETLSASIAMVPKNLVKLEGKNAAAMLRLSEAMEEHEDVQNVYSNFDIDEKELEALA